MKHYLIFISLYALISGIPQIVKAIPAYPFPTIVTQPDGNSLTIRQHGDEFMNYLTTEDGYMLVQNTKGFYVYAQILGEQIIPSNYIAKNAGQRTLTDKEFLKQSSPDIQLIISKTQLLRQSANVAYRENRLLEKSIDYKRFKGLIILVEFSDRKFEKENVQERFDAMTNQKNYSTDNSSGSVRDYYFDNSMGKFEPTFDVVGPVSINYRQIDAHQTDNAHTLVMAACTAASSIVNYKNYDLDNNNQVDMVYLIFAGAGSHIGGNNRNYLWPHASTLPNYFMAGGMSFGRYACSVELNGLEGSHIQDGIGTIVHEFSHVLGLQDYYDVDYEKNGGESEHPASWSVMASGSYLNKSKTPCGYSLYERYALGWATPQLINKEDVYTLSPLNSSNTGYRINAATENEFFLLENRQQTKWDEYLPGRGMLVFRIDSTDVDAWTSNKINIDPKHMHYELLRAQKKIQESTVWDTNADPFPGSANIISLTNQTSPSLRSGVGSLSPIILSQISETSNGNINFTTVYDKLQEYKEDFEDMAITTVNSKNIQGKFSKWDFTKAFVQSPGGDSANGSKSIGIYKGGEIKTTTPINKNINSVSFRIANPTQQTTTIRLYYSTNNGISWIPTTSSSSSILVDINAGEISTLSFIINSQQPTVYKINMTTGGISTEEMNYIDDFTLRYQTETPPVSIIEHQKETEKELSIIQEGAILSVISEVNAPLYLYTINGMLVGIQNPKNGKVQFQLPNKGIYILCQGTKKIKIIYQ